MPRKNNDTPPEPPDYTDKIETSLTLTVEGTDLHSMLASAKVVAAPLLRTPAEFLYVISHSTISVTAWRRFENPRRPDTWSCSVSIGVIPEDRRETAALPKLTLLRPGKAEER